MLLLFSGQDLHCWSGSGAGSFLWWLPIKWCPRLVITSPPDSVWGQSVSCWWGYDAQGWGGTQLALLQRSRFWSTGASRAWFCPHVTSCMTWKTHREQRHSNKVLYIYSTRVYGFFTCLPAILAKGTTEILVSLLNFLQSSRWLWGNQPGCLLGGDAGRSPLLPASWDRTNSKLRHPLGLLKCSVSSCFFSFSTGWTHLCRNTNFNRLFF